MQKRKIGDNIMKIYPNNSKIMVTNNVNKITDIPLAYIDTQHLNYRINTIIDSTFKYKEKKEILPYDNLKKEMICLFDKYENQIDYEELQKHIKRDKDNYFFMPYGSVSFYPKTFEYRVIAKKNIIYNSKMLYNINVITEDSLSKKDNSSNIFLTNLLMPIFGQASLKGAAPSNVLINNGSVSYGDISSGNIKDKDFYFCNYDNLQSFSIDSITTDKLLKSHTNIFNFINNSDVDFSENAVIPTDKIIMYKDSKESLFEFKKTAIYDNIEFKTNIFFNVPSDMDGVKYHNLFKTDIVPVLLEEREGKGFIIYASKEILLNSTKYSKVIYETLFYVFSKTYSKTITYKEWISDKMPDFIVVNNKLTKQERFISKLELHKMFGLNRYEVTPYSVEIDKNKFPFVKFTGFFDDYLTFEKDLSENNKQYQDPVNEKNSISIYTEKQNIVYFNNFIYKINDSLDENINIERINNNIRVTIKPYRHSDSGLYVKTITYIDIPLIFKDTLGNSIQITNEDFYIVCKQNSSSSYIEYKNVKEYKKSDGLILATIQVRQDSIDTIMYDMRQRGGGLPENEKDNYDCFDIGHIFGRPYRKGGSMVITLPKRLKDYKDIIEETVKLHCSAEEYPIILFKEDK